MRKKSFLEVFLVKFLIAVPIVAIILFITVEALQNSVWTDTKNYIDEAWLGRQERFNQVFAKGDFESVKNELNFYLNMHTETTAFNKPGVYAVAYVEDQETGEIVLNSDAKLFFLCRVREEDNMDRNYQYYLADPSCLEQSDGLKDCLAISEESLSKPGYESYLGAILGQKRSECTYNLLEGYLDDANQTIYPTSILTVTGDYIEEGLLHREGTISEEEKTVTLAAPENAGELKKYTRDDISLPGYVDGAEVSSMTILLGGTGKAEDFDRIKAGRGTGATSDYTDAEGHPYIIYLKCKFDFWQTYGSTILVIGIIYSVVAIGVCLILSAITYNRLKYYYQTNEYRKALMNSMAHDLKTPLAAMSGYAETLLENPESEKRDHYAQSIYDNTVYMNGIITDVLELSRIEESSLKLKKEKVDFCELAKECFEVVKPLAEEKELTFETKKTFVRSADKTLMKRAVENLLTNAVKYTGKGGNIRVYSVDKPFYHRLVIENTPVEPLKLKPSELWKPFVKDDESRSDKSGTGLGLSIAKNIFNRHKLKSKIEVTDKTFKVEIW